MVWPTVKTPTAMTRTPKLAACSISAIGLVALLGVTATPLYAQQGPSPSRPQSAPKSQAPKPQTEAAAQPAAAGTDGALRQRVEQLEEQLVDMQVTVGTLESLTKGAASSSSVFRGGSTASPTPGGGADGARVDALEQQMRQISTQLDQLAQQMRQQSNRQGSALPPANTQGAGAGIGVAEAEPASRPVRAQAAIVGSPAATPPPAASPPLGGFGSTTVLPDTGADTSPKQLYETAYGYLLAQDYGAAEVAFDEFLKRYPSDQLAGNAQYWLGETHFVRGQFKAAAGAFLKGYQTYTRSSKAPDSLLKLAMSLDRLGQKDAACSSFNELTVKFPNATAPVRSRADAERRRLACA
jgi:tol-pal system protein YbgF